LNQLSPPGKRTNFAHVADRVGASASFLCALHCAALPFVLAVLPVLGLSFLANHRFERIFIGAASALALTVLSLAYPRHRNPLPLSLLLAGLLPLWLGGFLFDGQNTLGLHALLVSIGGCCLAFAHITNMRVRNAR